MAHYRYRAFNEEGLTASGEVTADSEAHAFRLLQQRGLKVSEITGVATKTLARFKPETTARLLEDLAVLIEAGYTYTAALTYRATSSGNKAQRAACEDSARLISAGKPFARSLEATGLLAANFSEMLVVAEGVNKTTYALRSIAGNIRNNIRFTTSVRKALAYPTFLLVAVLIIMGIFLFEVFPTIESIYSESDMELPGIFVAIEFARSMYIGTSVLLLFLPLLLLQRFRRWSRMQAMRTAARLPISKDLLHLLSMRDFLAVLAISVSSGSTVKASFGAAEKVVNDVDDFYREVSGRVLKGQDVGSIKPPHHSLAIALNLLDVGLKANRLGECADQARIYVEQEISKRTDMISGVAGPAGTVVVGLLVGGMAFTMISALSAINNGGLAP